MPTFKTITVKMGKKPKGKDTRKTRKQRVQVLKSGKFKFVKNLKKGSSSKNKSKNKSKSNSKGGRKTANNGFRIPSLPNLAKIGVAGSWLMLRQTGTGVPLIEIQNKNYIDAVKGFFTNARDVIMTADGWMQVILPIAAISIVQKIVPKTRVNIMGINWSLM